jgi:glycosyltransferase involved in cell wall biosynthesis
MYGPLPSSDGAAGYMTRDIQRDARQCFVHSASALSMLESDRAPDAVYAPATTLLYALPRVADDARPRVEVSRSPTIISLGAVAEVKGIAELISAFALVAQTYPGARLVLAGAAATDADSTRWGEYARAHAGDAKIEIIGRATPERYAQALGDADVAVQLRRLSNGEASGATADCLAAGLPTIVTDLGWAGELPDGAVSRVPLGAGAQLIAERIDELLVDREKRAALSAAALDCARTRTFARAADLYVEALGLA